MLITRNNISPPPRRSSKSSVATSQPSQDKVEISQAAPNPTKTSLAKLLTSVSALALTALPQGAQAAQAAVTDMAEIQLVLGSNRAADIPVDPHLGERWSTPDRVLGTEGGRLYHYPKGAVATVTAKHVTAETLAPGAPRLTARGVDPNQMSKQYPEGQIGWQLTEPYKECTKFGADGSCLETRWDAISYQNISCLYKNEDTGETVRVLHRSTNNTDTPRMDRGVCAGHRLIKDSNGFWGPVQTDSSGKTLYVNPLNIVEMEVVSQ